MGEGIVSGADNGVDVLVVDDHRTFAELLVRALLTEPGMHCVGIATDGRAALERLEATHPDVVLMDVDLGGEDGIDLARQMLARSPDLLVVVLTGNATVRVMRRAADAGACALLAKDGALDELLHAIATARHGGIYVHPELLRSMVARPGEREPAPLATELTPRERGVLELLARGRHVTDIARELGISVHTCRGHVKSLLAKLGAHSQLEAVAIAGMHGLVDGTTRV